MAGLHHSPKDPQPEPSTTPGDFNDGESLKGKLVSVCGGPSEGRHPKYRGVRSRSGKWVSEIRKPQKTSRIWLGTYPSAEMAAVAYDVAAHALKGSDAILNFPNAISSRTVPASTSPWDIRSAAAAAAKSAIQGNNLKAKGKEESAVDQAWSLTEEASGRFVDEEEIFNLPNLLESMAQGMLMSPPRLTPPMLSDDSPETSDCEGLWSFPYAK